jgi:carbonic anhydrase
MKTVEITYRYGMPSVSPRPRPSSAAAARVRLNEGNRTFAALLKGLAEDDAGTVSRIVEIDARDLGIQADQRGQPSQLPFAAVLGCSDARVPIELIFNEGPNDLFVVRVAGNGLGNDVLGSLRYAVEHLRGSLRLVVILGHSGCGALTAAVDIFLEPAEYLPLVADHALRNILDRQLIAVQASARKLANTFGPDVVKHAGYREALTETAIVMNAALTAHAVQQELRSFDPHELRAVYGVYLLQSHEIWAPARHLTKDNGLAEPPADLASFIELNAAIVGSDRIASLLAG